MNEKDNLNNPLSLMKNIEKNQKIKLLQKYLLSRGWKQIDEQNDKCVMSFEGRMIYLPIREENPEKVEELIRTVTEIYGKSRQELISDMYALYFDTCEVWTESFKKSQ